MIPSARVRGVVTCLVVAALAGCSSGEPESDGGGATTGAGRQALPPVASASDSRAVIDDWYDNGKIDATHSCDAVRAAIEQLVRSEAREDLRRVAAVVCVGEPPTIEDASQLSGRRCDLLEPGWNVGYVLCQDPGNPSDRGRFEFRGRGRIPIAYPYPGPSGHWSDGFLSRDGKTLLLQWTAECEVPFAFFVPARGGTPQLVTGERRVDQAPPTIAHGWTLDGEAIVEVMPGCGERGKSELWLISPDGDRRRLTETG